MRFQVTKNKTVIRREVRSAHSGIDRHRFRVDIPDTAATVMTNFRSSGVARWRKRYEPSLVADLGHDGYRPNGMSEWTDSAGVVRMVVACAGAIHYATAEDTWNHATVVGGISISTTNAVRFQQYDGVLYGVDGEIYFKVYNDAGTVKVARVLQPSTNGPIEPGSVVIYDGVNAVLFDSDLDGNLLTAGSADKGDIDYDTSRGSIEAGFISGDCTADYDRGVLKTDTAFARADTNGKLIKHATVYADIGEATLTDGTHSTTDCIADAALGHIEHTSATFTARAPLTISYKHTLTTGNSELFTFIGVPDGEYTFSGTIAGITASSPIKKGTATFSYGSITDGGDGVLYDGATPVGSISYDSGAWDYTIIVVGIGGPYDIYVTAGFDQWGGVVTGESIGKANADGKFMLKVLYPACISGRMTLNDGSKSVVAVGADLFDGETDVGGWTASTGAVSVSTGSTFTPGAMIDATYYNKESVTGESIADPTDFVLGSSTNPSGPTDLVWLKNKMWLACGKLLYRSDSLSPEVFSTAPNELKGGKGVNIMRLIPHTKDRLIAFKGDGSTTGSIHPIDLSSFDSSEWQANIYFDDQSLCSPNAIMRANSADGADIFFATREGLRTLKTTPQDNVAGPSLPIDLTIKDAIGTVTEAQLLSSWAIMYDGEYLRWINDTVWALDMNVPRNSLQEGWTKIYMPASGSIAGIEADCGCVCNFGGGPKLYIGGPDGKIVRMFAVDGGNFTATYEGMGLVPVFNDNKTVFGDMIPLRVGVRVSDESSGLYYAWLKDDKNNVYSLGGNNVGTATPVIASDVSETGTFTIPVGASSAAITFKVPKVNTAFSWVITLHAPEGAVDVIDYANMSDETTTGAIVQLMGAPTQAGWTGTYEVRCTV